MFKDLQAHGVNAVRFWVHIDGRCSPTFSDDIQVTGVSKDFYPNLDDFLARAKAHNIGALLTLWAVDLENTDPAYSALRPTRTRFITDPARTQSYIDKVLIPMAHRYDKHPELIGYEVMNEPDFGVASDDVWGAGKGTAGPGQRDVLPLATVQRFIAQQVVALNQNTTKLVNGAGSAAYKWLAEKKPGKAVGNWWSDEALQAQVPEADKKFATNDAYQVHWYDWEKGDGYDFSPWQGNGPSFFNNGNKPTFVGEMPAKDDKSYTVDQKMQLSLDQGYAGYFFWSYNDVDGEGTWGQVKDHLKAFHDAHASDIDLNLKS